MPKLWETMRISKKERTYLLLLWLLLNFVFIISNFSHNFQQYTASPTGRPCECEATLPSQQHINHSQQQQQGQFAQPLLQPGHRNSHAPLLQHAGLNNRQQQVHEPVIYPGLNNRRRQQRHEPVLHPGLNRNCRQQRHEPVLHPGLNNRRQQRHEPVL